MKNILGTDLGLAIYHQSSPYSPRSISVVHDSHLVGTARHASINGPPENSKTMFPQNAWICNWMSITVQSPRDDLESLGYMMVYLMQGRLPWTGCEGFQVMVWGAMQNG
jgi:hypothetical protein